MQLDLFSKMAEKTQLMFKSIEGELNAAIAKLPENQQTRAAALNLVTAAIILFNCRYLGHAVEEMRRRGSQIDPAMLSRLSPLGWDRINLTGDYVWSDHLDLDANGLMPLLIKPLP